MKRRMKPSPSGKFRKSVLPNGLTLVSERHPEFRSLSMGVWVKAGTRDEKGKEVGVSHFLEHMLFKGTEKRSALDIAVQVDRAGGEFNAFTSRENTCFHLMLLDRDFDLGADILSDVLLHSEFDSEEMERERKVILQEIAMVEESPEELAHDAFFELVYGRHGLGKPILGTETSIRRLRRGDMLRYFHRHYRPENLIVSVAGNISHEAVVRGFKALSKREWPGRSNGRPSGAEITPAPPVRGGTWWIKRPTEQVHVVWGVQGPKYSARDRFAAYLLNVHLGGGMSSVLFQEIREKKGLAYTVYSSLSSFLDSGLFSVYAACAMGQVPTCLKLIEESVRQMAREPLSDADLEAAKDNLKGTILLNSDSVESRMSSIAKNEIFLGEYVPPEKVCQRIDEVRPEDIRRLARKLLSQAEPSVLLLGPKPSGSVAKKLRPEFPARYQK